MAHQSVCRGREWNSKLYRQYFLASATLAIFASLLIAAYSFLVDPYAMYKPVAGFESGKKTDLFYHLRLHKPYAMESRKATHLIIGSSRSARLNPDIFGEDGYNASMPGIRLREVRRLIEHAQAIRPLRSLYIGLDYYMFRGTQTGLTSHYSDDRLRKISPSVIDVLSHWIQMIKDGWSALFSVDAILASADVVGGIEGSQRIYHDNGTWTGVITDKPPKWLYSYVNRHKMDEFKSEVGKPTLAEFEKLLEFARDHKVPTTILISPFHASVMNTVRLADRWDAYLSWQRSIVAAVERTGGDVEVFGIETSRDVIMERMEEERPFFIDGVHYNLAAGREIMNCLAGFECDKKIRLVPLTLESIDQYLQGVDALMKLYPEQCSNDYNSLLKWLDKIE